MLLFRNKLQDHENVYPSGLFLKFFSSFQIQLAVTLVSCTIELNLL